MKRYGQEVRPDRRHDTKWQQSGLSRWENPRPVHPTDACRNQIIDIGSGVRVLKTPTSATPAVAHAFDAPFGPPVQPER